MQKFKLSLIIILGLLFLSPLLSLAQETGVKPENFKARVIEVLKVENKSREDGSVFKQQDLKLMPLSGSWQGKEIVYQGISEVEVADMNKYQVGDKVFVDGFLDENGQATFYVVDFVRSDYLYVLALIFVLVVLLVGRFKGLKALLGLLISFVIIIKFMLPQILLGHDPFIISLIGGVAILAFIIYLAEGFKVKSHLAILSVLVSLSVTLALSLLFTKLARLSGMSQEEAAFLIGIGGATINFQGLLLAGFIIGAIGVLDDIVVGQIEAVEQIQAANPNLSQRQVFSSAYKIGNTHLGAIVNTLFLTYAGAALPLLMLFIVNQSGGVTFNRLINTEIVSTEIVRTLVGSIGVMLSMPVATFLASLRHRKIKN